MNNKLLAEYFTNYQRQKMTECVRNENRVYLIKLVLDRMKKMCLKVENLWLKKTKR